jgi:mRNA-degrading endonuclease RelE of RelBE toxin-antitoxin system
MRNPTTKPNVTRLRFQITLHPAIARTLKKISQRQRRNRSNTLESLIEAEDQRTK